MKHIIKLGGHFYYNRRIPAELKEFDPRTVIRVSLKTDSREQARRKAVVVNDQIEDYWKSLMAGQSHDHKRFNKTIRIARQMGFSYQPMSVVANLPFQQLEQRVLALDGATLPQIEAVLGTKEEGKISMEIALDKFWGYSKTRIINKSPDQIRKWKNPRLKAMENFITVVGNKDLKDITRDDVLAFRDWWLDRIQNDNKNAGSANKDLIHLKNVVETVSDNLKLEIDTSYLFKKLMLPTRFKQTRLPFTNEQIHILLSSNKLANLNEEARWFLFAASETGARPSEIVGLLAEDIKLNDDIPHICITDRKDKSLKTPHSERKIPLVGYSLEAFKAMPNGFPRYRHKPDNLTNFINKYLRDNKLMPSPQHSIYSFRHSFQDRILSVDAPDRVQAELMGHKFHRPSYGDGASLKQKQEWLRKIQLKQG